MRAKAAPMSPRLLTAEQAAAYLGEIPVAAFKRMALGVVPLGAHIRYDRVALDAYLDGLAGMPPQSPPAGALRADNDDPEAAFERSAPDFSHAPRRP